uniref:WxxW domain-containing protein n=1 Tax=Labrus bergylta TaxID=56723 RepID=A0A3Q3MMD5_9LABR
MCHDYRVRFLCAPEFCSQEGSPTTTTTSTRCWTHWFDRDNPSGSGDWETLPYLKRENPGNICDNPLQIEVQTTTGLSLASTGDVITVADAATGFICKNSEQTHGMCHDYRVRFLCAPEFCSQEGRCWTHWFDRDNPSGSGDWETLPYLKRENPGNICDNPLQIEVQTTTGLTDAATGFICKNSEQTHGMCHDYRVRFLCACLYYNDTVVFVFWKRSTCLSDMKKQTNRRQY